MTRDRIDGIRAFLREASRRRVFRVAIMYAVAAWIVIQVSVDVFPALQLPDWTVTLVVVLVALGFPVALALGWAFDITPSGVERTRPLPPERSGSTRTAEPASRSAASDLSGLFRGTRTARREVVEPERKAGPAAAVESPPQQPPDPQRVRRAAEAHLRHELRTPVDAILGYSEMLLEDAEGDELLVDELRRIQAAGRSVLTTLERGGRGDDAGRGGDTGGAQATLHEELRTPITAVISYGETLLDRSTELGRDAMIPDLRRLLEAARRLLASLDEARYSGGAPSAEPGVLEESDAAALAREALSRIEPLDSRAARSGTVREGSLLVVDDSEINRELLALQLARDGYRVTTAENGREALQQLQAEEFDLVLLDIMMPELDGFEVLQRMKRDEATREIPVIMITALDELDSVVRCIEAGAADYLSKPFDPVLLKTRIGATLELRRARELERAASERLRSEQELTEKLLSSMLPPPIATRFRSGEPVFAESFAEVTALVAELDSPRTLSGRAGPEELVASLSEIFASFDRLAAARRVEMVRVSGHTYCAVAGAPTARDDQADVIAELALEIGDETSRFATDAGEPFRVRIGVHSGPLVTGLLQTERLVYDFWGDAVETARQLQASAAAGSIQVSPAVYARLREKYVLEARGVVDLEGKEQMRTYWLRGRAEPASPAPR